MVSNLIYCKEYPQYFPCVMIDNLTYSLITRDSTLRDWSLITGRGGGLQNGRGGARKVLPLRKGGGGVEKVLAMLKGGHKKFRGSFYVVA